MKKLLIIGLLMGGGMSLYGMDSLSKGKRAVKDVLDAAVKDFLDAEESLYPLVERDRNGAEDCECYAPELLRVLRDYLLGEKFPGGLNGIEQVSAIKCAIRAAMNSSHGSLFSDNNWNYRFVLKVLTKEAISSKVMEVLAGMICSGVASHDWKPLEQVAIVQSEEGSVENKVKARKFSALVIYSKVKVANNKLKKMLEFHAKLTPWVVAMGILVFGYFCYTYMNLAVQ